METNKPRMLITERVKGIPAEATCSSCPDAIFRTGEVIGETVEEGECALKGLFEHHFRAVHEEKPSTHRQKRLFSDVRL
jgi:hypothetical protein